MPRAALRTPGTQLLAWLAGLACIACVACSQRSHGTADAGDPAAAGSHASGHAGADGSQAKPDAGTGNTGSGTPAGATDASTGAGGASHDDAALADDDAALDAGPRTIARPNREGPYRACSGDDLWSFRDECQCATSARATFAWSFCAPACNPDMTCPQPSTGTATAICDGLSLLVTGCYLDCRDGKQCPDGMECVLARGGSTHACVTRDLVWYDAAAHLPADPSDAAQPAVLARDPVVLKADFVVDGELSASDPSHGLAVYSPAMPGACSPPPAMGAERPYDAYAFDLVGPGPHRILADACSSSDFANVLLVYQAPGSDTPFDLADPCKNLVAGESANSPFCTRDSSFVPVDGLSEGRVVVVMTSILGGLGGYTLRVSSDTAYPGTLEP